MAGDLQAANTAPSEFSESSLSALRTSPVITSVAEVVRLQSELSRDRLPQELISGPFLRSRQFQQPQNGKTPRKLMTQFPRGLVVAAAGLEPATPGL